MGASFAVILIVTMIWGAIGGFAPLFVPRRDDRNVIQVMLRLIAVSCYAIWLFTYMAQMNPLFGPQLDGISKNFIQRSWA